MTITQVLKGVAVAGALAQVMAAVPAFAVTLNLHNTHPGRSEEGRLRFSGVEVPTRTSKFDLSLEVLERDG